MRTPRMTKIEQLVFAACYAQEIAARTSEDNSAAEEALENALWSVECFRQALRSSRKP